MKPANISTVILDEADEMMNRGFFDSINEILEEVPAVRRTLLFSTTMLSEIAVIAKKYMDNPVEITNEIRNSSAENINRNYFRFTQKTNKNCFNELPTLSPTCMQLFFA